MNSPPHPSRTVLMKGGMQPLYVPAARDKLIAETGDPEPGSQSSQRNYSAPPELKVPEMNIDTEKSKREAAKIDAKLAKILSGSVDFAELTSDVSKSSVENELVDEALESMLSLPEVLCDVAVHSKRLDEEIQHQLEIFAERKTSLRIAIRRLEEAKIELAQTQRRILISESKSCELAESSKILEEEIVELLAKKKTVRNRQVELDFDKKLFQRDVDEWNAMKEIQTRRREEAFKRDPAYDAYVAQQERIKALKAKLTELCPCPEKRKSIMDGTCYKAASERKAELETKLKDTDLRLEERRAKIAELKANQKKVKDEIKVMKKKHRARIQRMKCQIREYKAKREAEEYEAAIRRQQAPVHYRIDDIDFNNVMD